MICPTTDWYLKEVSITPIYIAYIGDKSLSCDFNYFNFIHNARDNLKSGRKETIKIIANVTLWLTPPGSITAIPVTNLETLVWFSPLQCWFGFAVISVLQNTLGSTLGKERAHLSENKGGRSEWKKFGKTFKTNGSCFNDLWRAKLWIVSPFSGN